MFGDLWEIYKTRHGRQARDTTSQQPPGDLNEQARQYADHADYTPAPHEIPEYEDIFGAQLAAGHTIKQAARFLIELGNNRL